MYFHFIILNLFFNLKIVLVVTGQAGKISDFGPVLSKGKAETVNRVEL